MELLKMQVNNFFKGHIIAVNGCSFRLMDGYNSR